MGILSPLAAIIEEALNTVQPDWSDLNVLARVNDQDIGNFD